MTVKYEIEIDGKKVVLTEEKARELYSELRKRFEPIRVIEYVPYVLAPSPQPLSPIQPTWIRT